MRTASITGLLLLCAACAGQVEDPDLRMCLEKRPQICTNEYNPVCATLADGTTQTRATGCTACSDPEVVGWVMGECPVG